MGLEHILTMFLGVLQLILLVILALSYTSNKFVNVYLIFFVLMSALRSLGFGGDQVDLFTNDEFSWMRLAMVISIPAVYLYIRALLKDEKRISIKVLLHFLYPILWFGLLTLQSIYAFIPADFWYFLRKINIIAYATFYLIISIRLIKDFYENRNLNPDSVKHYNYMKNWIFIFFTLIVLIDLRALIHFCFDLENKGGIFADISLLLKIILVFLIVLRIFTSPEILFGYTKLEKTLSRGSESETEINDRIVFTKNQYYIKNKPIQDYFDGKTLECLMIILGSKDEFLPINSLDDLFVSEFKASSTTVKKRREHSIKEIKLVLSTRLQFPIESVLIESPDDIDKRIKRIKLNPEILKLG